MVSNEECVQWRLGTPKEGAPHCSEDTVIPPSPFKLSLYLSNPKTLHLAAASEYSNPRGNRWM